MPTPAGKMLTGRYGHGIVEQDGKVLVVGGTDSAYSREFEGNEMCTLEKNEFFTQFNCKVNAHGLKFDQWKWLCKEAFGHDVCDEFLTEDHYREGTPYVFAFYQTNVALMPVPDNFCPVQ